MDTNPFLGVCFHWLGGLGAASFYVFYRGVRNWPWENYWIVGGFFAWIVAPWAFGLAMTNDLAGVIARTPPLTLALAACFGALWGVGGTLFGLTMRYLGMSLGMGVALGFCAAFGTLIPPLMRGQLGAIAASTAGRTTLAGVAVCFLGIGVAALAGLSKERELPEAKKRVTIREFNFGRGMVVATFAGILSAMFAYGLDAASPMADLSASAGTAHLWTGLPKLIVVLTGGFVSNAVWCFTQNIRNRTGYLYASSAARPEHAGAGVAGSEPTPEGSMVRQPADRRVPQLANYAFCAAAGVTWYLQFFFYTMGETQMGRFGFSSWTLHMASIIIFSTLWGVFLREWQGASGRTHALVCAGIAVLILSTLLIGYGNYLGSVASAHGGK